MTIEGPMGTITELDMKGSIKISNGLVPVTGGSIEFLPVGIINIKGTLINILSDKGTVNVNGNIKADVF